jgi:hypothetical protein
MAWTNIPKPVGTNYTNVNPNGKTQYDQADIEYDDPDIFYDGINPNQWTDVLKPSFSLTWNDLPIAWQDYNSPWGSPTWTKVNKPNV